MRNAEQENEMNIKKTVSFMLTNAIAGLFISALLSGPVLAKNKLPEVDSDGLHLVKDSKVAVAYMKPGADLGQYNKVKLLDCYVDFVKNWQREYNMGQVGLDGRVTDKDAEKIKTRLAAEFTKVFTEELTKKGFPIVDAAGADVLILRPALINVDVTAPDIPTAGISATLVNSAGSMALYMEMYDSATNELIARVIDPQADDKGFAQAANRVTNKVAADEILRHWADLLAKHLGHVTQMTGGN
jgi:hypothetical protein